MAAAAPVVGSVIVGLVVSEGVKALGPKIGLSDSMSNTLGMVGGVAAGYGVAAGAGSTAATEATANATSGQVGTQLPAGYGGPVDPTGSGFTGTGPVVAGASAPAGGVGGTVASPFAPPSLPASTPLPSKAQVPGPHSDTGLLQAAKAPQPTAAAQPAAAENPIPRTKITSQAQEGGMLSQGATAQPDAASQVISESVSGQGEETNWFAKLFTPEKTMDLVMAAMQGYGQAGMAKEQMEYPEEVAKDNAKDWKAAYPGRSSLSLQYPSNR